MYMIGGSNILRTSYMEAPYVGFFVTLFAPTRIMGHFPLIEGSYGNFWAIGA